MTRIRKVLIFANHPHQEHHEWNKYGIKHAKILSAWGQKNGRKGQNRIKQRLQEGTWATQRHRCYMQPNLEDNLILRNCRWFTSLEFRIGHNKGQEIWGWQ